jgi:NAD(P)-dependent dehydrogenase (short-subunit alcohol dehydrogenase family)
LLELGASVVVGDQNPLPEAFAAQHQQRLTHVSTDITVWTSLLNLFNVAISQHQKIDHVFTAAGIKGFRANYLGETFDPETGNLQEPSADTFNINLRGSINTAYLGLYHMRHQSPQEGSIVLIGSAAGFTRLRTVDYTTSKHGVLGFMRGLMPALNDYPGNIRVNCVSPSWTRTAILSTKVFDHLGYGELLQDPEVVARSVVLCMADGKRHGQNIYSRQGSFWEVDNVFMKLSRDIVGEVDEDVVSIILCFPPRSSVKVHVANRRLQVVKTVLKHRAEVMALEAAKKAKQEEGTVTEEEQTQA